MSAGVALWLRIAFATGAVLVLALTLSPTRPHAHLPWAAAPVVGTVSGGLLFLLVARRRPRLRPSGSLALIAARHGFLGLWAANEEIVWRRFVLGELLFGGALAALAASTVGFALAHRARRGLHLGTGVTFGGLYLATGYLVASIVAHWTYNALVDSLAGRAQRAVGPA